MFREFKKFLLRGSILDLAVAVVIGVAFNTVIQSLVQNVIMPIIGIVGGKPSFDEYTITLNDSIIMWGTFVTAMVSFVIVAAALFVAIRAFEKLQSLRKSAADVDEATVPLTVGEELLVEIRDLLRTQGPSSPLP